MWLGKIMYMNKILMYYVEKDGNFDGVVYFFVV